MKYEYKILAAVAGALIMSKLMMTKKYTVTYSNGSDDFGGHEGAVGYGDAVAAVMKSDMYDRYKKEAVSIIARDGSSEYYKAIIAIAGSKDYDRYRLEMIKTITD